MEEIVKLNNLIRKHKGSNEYLGALNISVGNDFHEDAVRLAAKFGKKVLFCTGNTSMRNLGFVDKYLKFFKKYGFSVSHYDNISANPTLMQMEEGVRFAKESNPDFIFALGGGSTIDTAKVISVGIFGDIWDFVESRNAIDRAIPIVASSTTSGTGSHVTPYAVITNTSTLQKKTLKNHLLLPKLSIVDVDITKHAPKYITATTGFDVLCHSVEVFTRNDCTPAAKEFSLKSMELIQKHLMNSYRNGMIGDKIGMAFADIYAGIALSMVGTHVPHAISHPISARFPLINHGQSLAYIMLETSKKQTEKGKLDLKKKFEYISRALGGNGDVIETLSEYIKILGLSRELQKFSEQEAEQIISDTLGYRRPSVDRSPAKLNADDIKEIVYNSLLHSKN